MAERKTTHSKEVVRIRSYHLTELAAARKMSKSEVAKALRCDMSYASRLLDGHRTPSLEVACRIAILFDQPLAQIAKWVLGHRAGEVR